MGTWGVGSFENDQAGDFVYELEESGVSLLDKSLSADLGAPYLDACVGAEIVAAAEVVAALAGRPAADLPTELSTWVGNHQPIELSHYRDRAIGLLGAVLSERSELRRLWEENQKLYPEWCKRIDELKDRILR